MAKSFYETLGVSSGATPADIRSAYRRLVLKHHPDHNPDPKSREVFLAITQAYEVLSDPEQRQTYDDRVENEARQAAERARVAAERAAEKAAAASAAPPRSSGPPPGWRSDSPVTSVAADVQRLTSLFSRGNHAEADKLARRILSIEPKHPVPYAILGDLARMRGAINEAATHYAYAAQFEPNNTLYQRRYEELLNSSQVVDNGRQRVGLAAEDQKAVAPMVAGLVVLLGGIYLALGNEGPILKAIVPISTWTLGSVVMMFLSGLTVGAALSVGNLLDRLQALTTNAVGKAGPLVGIGLVAVVNFWLAGLVYLISGAVRRSFNFSMNRLLLGIGAATLTLSGGAALSHSVDGLQVLLWGGNLIFMGTLVGWMVADAFRP